MSSIPIFPQLRPPRRVKNKIILLVVCLEVFSLTLWGTFTYQASKQELITTIGNQLKEAAYRTQTEIGNFLLPIHIQAEMVGVGLGSNVFDAIQAKHLYNHFIRSRPEVEELSLVDVGGRELLRVSRTRSYSAGDLRDLSQSILIQNAVANMPKVGDIVFSEYFEPQLKMATPVKVDGKVKHIIITVVNLKSLWGVVQKQRIGTTGYVYVVNNNLKLIGHDDPSLVLSQLYLPDTSVPVGLLKNNVEQSFKVYKNFAGETVAGVSRYDEVNNWWVVVEQPVIEGLAPLRRIINRFALIFCIAIVVTIISVLIFSRITMRPLQAFEDGILRIKNGERNVNVPVPKHTELATLAQSFNAMAKSLDEKIDKLVDSERRVRLSEEKYRALNTSLEQRVKDSTYRLRESNSRLEAAYHAAEQANKAKSVFLANMSHELRTPLNAVIGYAELLMEEVSSDDQRSDLNKVKAAGKHLLSLINDLLDLSKIEAGKMDFMIESFSVSDLVNDVKDTISPLADKNYNQLIIHVGTDIRSMTSDLFKLKQVLVNLLSNACKFTEHGTIELNLRTHKNSIIFEVKDSGIGMSEKNLNNIFSAFSQADHSVQNRYGGTGLGLVISRHYCNILGGEISVSSKQGVGSSFIVSLPRVFHQNLALDDNTIIHYRDCSNPQNVA